MHQRCRWLALSREQGSRIDCVPSLGDWPGEYLGIIDHVPVVSVCTAEQPVAALPSLVAL